MRLLAARVWRRALAGCVSPMHAKGMLKPGTCAAHMRVAFPVPRSRLHAARRFKSSSAQVHASRRARPNADNSGARGPSQSPTGNFFMDILHEILYYSPMSAMIGFTIGGLGATFFGALYFLHKSEYLDVGRLLKGADRIEFRVRRGQEEQDTQSQHAEGQAPSSQAQEAPSSQAQEAPDVDVIAVKETKPKSHTGSSLPSLFDVPLPFITLGGWLIAFVVTGVVAYTKARLRLQFREFVRQVNFSLNTIGKDNVLRLRTIRECTLNEILPDNPAGVNIVVSGARQVQTKNPFIALPASQYDLIMNQLLNTISPMFADGYIAEDQGLPVKHAWYYFGISFRKETIKMRKLRVVIAQEELLQRIARDPDFKPDFESPEHRVRLDTLRLMADLYLEQGPHDPAVYKMPTNNGTVMRLAKVKIALPDYTASTSNNK